MITYNNITMEDSPMDYDFELKCLRTFKLTSSEILKMIERSKRRKIINQRTHNKRKMKMTAEEEQAEKERIQKPDCCSDCSSPEPSQTQIQASLNHAREIVATAKRVRHNLSPEHKIIQKVHGPGGYLYPLNDLYVPFEDRFQEVGATGMNSSDYIQKILK